MYVSKTNLLFTSLLILLLSGCSGSGSDSEPEPATVSVSSISLTPTSLSLAVGESADITATVKPDNATDKRVSWTSSNPKVATVANGKVTAVAEGSTTITAYAGSAKAECRVTVTAAQITSITLDQSALELFPGETETLKATIAPASASSDHLTWESSDPTVATVDDSGTVSALAPGTTKITVKASGVQAECTVTVKTVAVTAVSINKTSLDLLPGDTETLVATVTPDNATDKSVSWESSNSSVATVNDDGKVTAITPGTAKITVKASGVQAECTVTVNSIAVTSVSLNKTKLDILVNDTETLVATVSPNNATDKSVSWQSSNTSVASVSSNGVVTAIASGTAQITVTAGSVSAQCTINVVPASISFTINSITLNRGEQKDLWAILNPKSIPESGITWVSSDTSVATVSNGVVKAAKKGAATITARTVKGASCSVEIAVTGKPAAGGSEDTGEVEW